MTNAWNDAFVGGDPDLPLPLRVDEVEHRVGDVALAQLVGVVDDHACSPGRADPAAVGIAEPRVDPVEHGVGQRRELLLDRAERARILREEDVGGRVAALLGDRRGELGAVRIAHLDLDARLRFEALEERLDDLFLAARVDGERIARALVVVPTAARQHERGEEWKQLLHSSPCKGCLTPMSWRTLQNYEKMVTLEACGRTRTRDPSGTSSFDGRCETSSTPSRRTR